MFYDFPRSFWWGTASSSLQTEGNKNKRGKSTWDIWYEKEPFRFYNNVGPNKLSDFYSNFKKDIDIMKELYLNSFRTSISWSRLIPGGTGEIDSDAAAYYHDLIDYLIEKDIEPIINLFHFDMPIELANKGGWANKEVVNAYVNYAKTVFSLYGEKVNYFITFNEPIVPIEMCYLYGAHYPFELNFKKGIGAAYNTIIAHCRAVEEYRKLDLPGQIGIVLNLTPSYPRSSHPSDVNAAKTADLLFNRSFLDPVVKGHFSKDLIEFLKENDLCPNAEKKELETVKNNKVDYLGVNYYQPRRIKAKENIPNPQAPIMPETFFDYYTEMPGRRMNTSRGWEIYPKGIYDLSIDIRDNYGNIPYFISENGMGIEGEEKHKNEDGQIQDDYRIEFIKEHLIWIHRAKEEGCNVFGYHLWTFIDNWSFTNAYKNRYGYVSLDLETNKRTVKKSGEWIRKTIFNNGFEG